MRPNCDQIKRTSKQIQGFCNGSPDLFWLSKTDNIRDVIAFPLNGRAEDLLMNFYLFREASISVYEDFCPYDYMKREGSASTASINQHRLGDPLKVLKVIRDETISNDTLQNCINTRIVGALIHLATMDIGGQEELIRPYKNNSHKELMRMIPNILKENYSYRLQVLSIWAAFSPSTYSAVHKAYSKIKGTDKKYEVK